MSSIPAMPSATPLLRHLYKQIRFGGPISVADYMRTCLTHPVHGYYTTRPNIFGKTGDFITAPHVSQVFPELLAVWISTFVSQNSASTYNLVELGPGTGNLLATLLPSLDRLRTPPSTTTLLEASPNLRAVQKSALQNHADITNISWADSLEQCLHAGTPTVFLAQEFLDALPVHVFHRVSQPASNPASWRERMIDVDPSATLEQPALRFVLSPTVTTANALIDLVEPMGDTVEICPEALSVCQRIATHVTEHGGAGLVIDYGRADVTRPSFRALSKHAASDVLAAPGAHDVTADVNFGHLRAAVERVNGARLWGCVTQGEFLLRLGAAQRFRVLGRKVIEAGGEDGLVDKKLERLQEDYERLVGGEEGMGEIYKVAVVCGNGDGVPFGFPSDRD